MFERRLADCARATDAALAGALAGLGPGVVTEAMGWALEGGKRFRAFLVLEGARLSGVADDSAVWAAAAVEAVHAYSLVHDDLPAMDDDDLRRGRPTVHVRWDEATAILAGDALQALGFQCLTREELHADAAIRLALVGGLARAAGAAGMVGGQARDIAAESAAAPLELDEIVALQRLKTGALIEWAATAGPILGRADPAPLAAYARALGLAFQVADDLLDVTGDAAAAGKRLGKDAGAGKATFVSLLGVEGARRRAGELVDASVAALDGLGAKADCLREAARFVIARQR